MHQAHPGILPTPALNQPLDLMNPPQNKNIKQFLNTTFTPETQWPQGECGDRG